VRAWAAEDITRGNFNVPEQPLGVLGDVRGLDVAGGSSYREKRGRRVPMVVPRNFVSRKTSFNAAAPGFILVAPPRAATVRSNG
jgi:hypothetical protein